MEQVDNNTEQQLVVNKAPDEKNATRPKEGEGRDRDINAIEGFEAAYKLAEVRRSVWDQCMRCAMGELTPLLLSLSCREPR